MSLDDQFRRALEAQEILRRASDPAGDILRQLALANRYQELLTSRSPVETLSGANAAAEHLRSITDLAASIRLQALTDTSAISRLAENLSSHTKLLAGPFDELKRSLSASDLGAMRLADSLTAFKGFEDKFRLPEMNEATRLASEMTKLGSGLKAALGIADPASTLQGAISGMQTPWLQKDELLLSAKSFATIQALGHGINTLMPFDDRLTTALRGVLGDWRDVATFPQTIIENPVERSDFYIARGFDANLTDFPAAAFDEITASAGLNDTDSDENEEQDAHELRSTVVFRQLFTFERRLRDFIEEAMSAYFGPGWAKHQLPNNMLDSWHEKRAKAVANGEEEAPIIHYADFTDYVRIIEKRDNWAKVFEPVFERVESVRESFYRLGPARVCTMHARVITLDDEAFIRLEIRRLLRAINSN